MLIFSDLHLKESTEEVCFQVLAAVRELARADKGHVVFCGDFWQLRYQVNVRLLNRVKAELHDWAKEGLHVDLVPGNHDQVTVQGENALEVLAEPGIRVWTEPGVEGNCGFCPYRKEPAEQLAALKTAASWATSQGAPARVVFAHFGLRGAEMSAGRKDADGLELPWWKEEGRYPLIILGHYHRHQHGPGYVYVGSPYQQSFGEAGNSPGVLRLQGEKWEHVPLTIGPRHIIVRWDAAAVSEPPAPPTCRAMDRIRLDVDAPYSMLANPELMEAVSRAGYVSAGAQVSVLPRDTVRESKFSLTAGESLSSAAERFVRERCPDEAEAEKRLSYLRRWAGEEKING